jgi:putative transposase
LIVESERYQVIELIDEACRGGARHHRACQLLEIDERTVRRWRRQQARHGQLADQRKAAAQQRTPANKLSAEERDEILTLCNQPEYRSLPPSQIVPRLADEGRYIASESSFYRVLREANQQHHRGRSAPPRKVTPPKGYKATAPNQVWSWDITYLATAIKGKFYRLYLIEDIYSRKIVGSEVHENETADHASQLIRKACLKEGIHHSGLVLHSDNGSPMKGATMLATLQRLGIVPSFSRPSVSDDNPYSESLFRTLKYSPRYPSQPFESLEAARAWVEHFIAWYNEEHCHSQIKFVTPAQRHRGEDKALLARREAVYAAARASNPARWSGDTRDWTPVTEVWLNPPKSSAEPEADESLAA